MPKKPYIIALEEHYLDPDLLMRYNNRQTSVLPSGT
jgi:hypothetical protein